MLTTIKIKRGNKSNLPTSVEFGEPLYLKDTKEIYIGEETGVPSSIKLLSDNIIDKEQPQGVAALDSDLNVKHSIKTDNLFFHAASEIIINYNQNLIVESLPKSEFRLIDWIINVHDQETGSFYSCKIMAHHDGTVVDYTEYAVIGIETVQFTVDISGTDINLYGLSSKNNQVVRTITTAIRFI